VAAASGELPALVTGADIRGDLHMHSTWSDGRDTIEAMVTTCRTLGYAYVAITDHSLHSAASRNLSVEGVRRQAEEIARLREQFPDIAILHGCEVDILPNGRLDFPDHVLEPLDIVLASLHDDAGHSQDQLLRRYMTAMRHPLVTMVTHPTNRLVPNRAGYDLDYDRLFETAVATNTVLEIDGAPAHLDMDGALARRAIAAGVTVSIDSDSHRAALLERQMRLGVMTARRGWVEPRHVLNTRAVGQPGAGALSPPFSSWPSPSRCTARRCCPASISAIPDRFRRPSDHRSSRHGTAIPCISRSATCSSGRPAPSRRMR
jgi:DNA polymerase (family 10)